MDSGHQVSLVEKSHVLILLTDGVCSPPLTGPPPPAGIWAMGYPGAPPNAQLQTAAQHAAAVQAATAHAAALQVAAAAQAAAAQAAAADPGELLSDEFLDELDRRSDS